MEIYFENSKPEIKVNEKGLSLPEINLDVFLPLQFVNNHYQITLPNTGGRRKEATIEDILRKEWTSHIRDCTYYHTELRNERDLKHEFHPATAEEYIDIISYFKAVYTERRVPQEKIDLTNLLSQQIYGRRAPTIILNTLLNDLRGANFKDRTFIADIIQMEAEIRKIRNINRGLDIAPKTLKSRVKLPIENTSLFKKDYKFHSKTPDIESSAKSALGYSNYRPGDLRRVVMIANVPMWREEIDIKLTVIKDPLLAKTVRENVLRNFK